MNDDALRYPIGKFQPKPTYTQEELDEYIGRIGLLPVAIADVIGNFTEKDFDTPYRDGGWTARQVIHHLSDSHMNAYIRFKWTLTEDTPVIKAYDEKLWAETSEVKLDPQISLELLRALHIKWVALLKSLTADHLRREYIHPETKKNIRLDRMVALYAWHGLHHHGHLRIIAQKSS